MNKVELMQSLAKKFDLTNAKSNEIINHILDSMATSLVKGKSVTFVGFGSFAIKKRAARKGVNPRTGESIKIAARKVVHFSISKKLKESINKK